jgi:hypothetical protein
VIDADPTATPVTATDVLTAFGATLIPDGTEATAGLLDTSPMLNPDAGAGVESVSVKLCVPPTATLRLAGEKVSDPGVPPVT